MDDRGPEVRFALDSPLEEAGCEPSVPPKDGRCVRGHLFHLCVTPRSAKDRLFRENSRHRIVSAHDSGTVWFATPSLEETFTP
jgi:hypothetical protein